MSGPAARSVAVAGRRGAAAAALSWRRPAPVRTSIPGRPATLFWRGPSVGVGPDDRSLRTPPQIESLDCAGGAVPVVRRGRAAASAAGLGGRPAPHCTARGRRQRIRDGAHRHR